MIALKRLTIVLRLAFNLPVIPSFYSNSQALRSIPYRGRRVQYDFLLVWSARQLRHVGSGWRMAVVAFGSELQVSHLAASRLAFSGYRSERRRILFRTTQSRGLTRAFKLFDCAVAILKVNRTEFRLKWCLPLSVWKTVRRFCSLPHSKVRCLPAEYETRAALRHSRQRRVLLACD